uniref:RING-type E3 ubiquitin transferase n=1 Tax=Homo sapiens TaxID=9606 RepID=A0A7I2V4L9_HUMAN
MSTKQITCRYFMHGVCREGSQCLFSHDLANSKPSTICKYYQKGYCAYGTRCRYDHTRPSAAAGGAVGTMAHSVPSPAFHSPHPPSEVTASIVKTNSHEPGKREKRTLVLRDRSE